MVSASWPDKQRPLTRVSVYEWEPAAQHPSVGWLGVPRSSVLLALVGAAWAEGGCYFTLQRSPAEGGLLGLGGAGVDRAGPLMTPALQQKRGAANGAAVALLTEAQLGRATGLQLGTSSGPESLGP